MNHIYALVNDFNPNPKNKNVDGRFECLDYVRYLPQKS